MSCPSKTQFYYSSLSGAGHLSIAVRAKCSNGLPYRDTCLHRRATTAGAILNGKVTMAPTRQAGIPHEAGLTPQAPLRVRSV